MGDSPRFRDAWTHHILAVLAVACVVVAFIVLLLHKVPSENKDLVIFLLGNLTAGGFIKVYEFYFGSSEGSKQKTDALIAAAIPAPGSTRIEASPASDVLVTPSPAPPDPPSPSHTEGPPE